MKRYITRALFVLLTALSSTFGFAQEEEPAQQEEVIEKPVKNIFESTLLIESQTTTVCNAKQLELIIHHRMGNVSNGITDLFGIYAASNIRLGLQYGVTDKITIGIGTEKNNKFTDINGKYLALQQTKSGSMPVSVAVYANATIDTRDEEMLGANYEFLDRFSYFGQVIVSRKFTDDLSLQLSPSYSHFNAVDRKFQHDKIGLMFGGRYKFTETMAAIFEYHQPFSINTVHDYQEEIQPGGALGIEIGTSTHAFQVFATNYQDIMAQKNYGMNINKFDSKGILIGFNITVRFN